MISAFKSILWCSSCQQINIPSISMSSADGINSICKINLTSWSKLPIFFCIYLSVCPSVYTCVHACSVMRTLCYPMDSSSSSVYGIFQGRILEQVAISYQGDLPDPGIEPASLASPALAGGFFTTSTSWEAHLHMTISQLWISKLSKWILWRNMQIIKLQWYFLYVLWCKWWRYLFFKSFLSVKS